MASNTPLAEYLRSATPVERERTAMLAGTSVAYLYQLAGCHRKNPGVSIASAIAEATKILSEQTGGRLRAISIVQLATMCVAEDFPNGGE